MIEPLVNTIEVPCDRQNAFDVFMDMNSWWPKERFATSVLGGGSVAELRVDARVGGRIVEIGTDGAQHLWGTIKVYDPYDYLRMDFHVPHPSEKDPGFSTVEVRFTKIDDDRTRVELTQSNWEALGDVAQMVRGGYDQAWVAILGGAYKAACAA